MAGEEQPLVPLVKVNPTTINTYIKNYIETTQVMNSSFQLILENGGAALTTGIKADLIAPFDGVITGWHILGDQAGDVVLDIWKDIFANYPPTVADTIINTGAGGVKPTVPAANLGAESSDVTHWTTAISLGDILRINIDSVHSFTRLLIVIDFTRVI